MANTNSNLAAEMWAVCRKDLISEWRSRHGVMTALLFGVAAVFTIGLACSTAVLTKELSADAVAALFWVALLFSGLTALGRGFLVEEEQRTGDLLRLSASSQAVYWGKLLYHLVLMVVTSVVLVPLFLMLMAVQPAHWPAFISLLALGALALTAATTLCGALVARASSRSALLAVLTLPVLLPQMALAVTGTKAALLGGVNLPYAWSSVGGLAAYAVALLVAAPLVFGLIWKD